MKGGFVVLDFGSQYTQLIARRLREFGVYSELLPFDISLEEIEERQPKGIILSGGPHSVFDDEAPKRDVKELAQVAPLLGVCYGMQLIASQFGGEVVSASKREYGLNWVDWVKPVSGVPPKQKVWMSHGDVIERIPEGFTVLGKTEDHPAALEGPNIWTLQFHPEVSHTDHGMDLLRAYVFEFCKAEANWDSPHISERLLHDLKEAVPTEDHVLCALSGGVDSTVVGTLLTRALGPERVHCVFVDNGLLRKGEFEQVLAMYNELGLNVHGVNARKEFMEALKDIDEPEEKRKRIGHKFIEIFKKEIPEGSPLKWLAQGTLYPDVIESVSLRGTNVTIKSHHNVGGLPKDLGLGLVEPLRELFKDEVRALGEQLGIPKPALWRHPFPGPGLAIRVLGAVDELSLDTLRECDDIYISALKESGLYEQIWQAFCVLLPVRSVGVQGDGRTYEKVVAIRAVTSKDGMTADWFDFPGDFLRKVSNKITNEVKGVNRVVYDVTSKPPGTIEWE